MVQNFIFQQLPFSKNILFSLIVLVMLVVHVSKAFWQLLITTNYLNVLLSSFY